VIINRSMIGKRFEDCSFDNFKLLTKKHGEAYALCKDVLNGESDGVVLLGPPGRGKTHLLVALAKEFNEEASLTLGSEDNHVVVESAGNRIAFWPHKELVSRLREESKSDGLFTVVVDECKECDLLILDDFGSEKISDFTATTIEEVLDYRHRDCLPIAISSNLNLIAMLEMYSPRIVSRFVETCQIINLDGDEDYRFKMANERRDNG